MSGTEKTQNRYPDDIIRGPARTVPAIIALLVFSLAFQGSRGLWEHDEGRYTNIALQMLQTGDYIVPCLNDSIPHFTKPPLTYWAIAGGISLLGWNEWGARLANALAFAATVMVVFALARRITPGRAWLSSIIYASFLFPFGAANVVTTDTLLTLWEALAVLGFVEWRFRSGRPHKNLFLVLMWAGFGLAFLTKGAPGLLPLLAIIVFVALADGWKRVPRIFSMKGIALFAVIGLGWYVMVTMTHKGLMTYFLRDEFVNRIATGMHHRNPEWFKPFAIYLPILMLGTLPWSLPLLRAARSVPETLFSKPWWRNKLENDQWPVFLFLWVLLPLAVFFASSSRLSLYILPLFVPLALTVGRLTHITLERKAIRYLLAAWMVMLPFLKLAGSFYPFDKDSREMARTIQDTVHPLPHEVVFIDHEPFWGLKLYLGCDVERVWTKADDSRGGSPEELLPEELLEKESGRVLVVDGRKIDPVLSVCRKLGLDDQILEKHGSWIFIIPVHEFKVTSEVKADKDKKFAEIW
jgi:4-amino-4-deoxy-L-arabinose transferase-like glycosyltransferase